MAASRALAVTPNQFATFGDLLKFLRRRAGLTQRDLSIAVGYSVPQISRLEQNLRLPDLAMIGARFGPGRSAAGRRAPAGAGRRRPPRRRTCPGPAALQGPAVLRRSRRRVVL